MVHHDRPNRLIGYSLSVLMIGGTIATASSTLAQIVPDSTLGGPTSTETPNVVIKGVPSSRIDGGAMRGSNLFHSFQEFNVQAGQRVYFANPTGVGNILTRITGANPSAILGTLGVDGSANLFLLNPKGIIFGPNAQLDITGSFVASTASSFKFADGSEFSATNPQAAPLLTVNVLPGLQYGPIPAGATITNRGNLNVGQDLTLVADRLDLQGQLQSGGAVALQASNGTSTNGADFSLAATGDITIGDIDTLSFTGDGGDIRLSTTNGRISTGHLFSFSAARVGSNAAGGAITLAATNGITTGPILSFAPGNSGAVTISTTSGNINVSDNIVTRSITANGGNVNLSTGNGSITTGNISTAQEGNSRGIAGTVNLSSTTGIRTEAITTGNVTSSVPDSAKRGGNVRLVTNGDIKTGDIKTFANEGAGTIALSTGVGNITTGQLLTRDRFGGGGNVTLSTDRGNVQASFIDTRSATNKGGDVTVASANGSVTTGNIISLSRSGNAGAVSLASTNGDIKTGDITTSSLTGNGAAINLAATNGSIKTNSLATTEFNNSFGNGGSVTISATHGNVSTADINSNTGRARNPRSGVGGSVSIAVTDGDLKTRNINSFSWANNGGQIDIAVQDGDAALGELFSYSGGNINTLFRGGNITVSVNNGSLLSAGLVLSFAPGRGGNVTFSATNGSITMDDVVARSLRDQGGDITIRADGGDLNLGSLFAWGGIVGNAPAGRGGTIRLTSTNDISTNSVNTTGKQGSGNIVIESGGSFTTRNSSREGDPVNSVISSDTFGSGRGGDILITAQSIALTDGSQISASTHRNGQGGNVTLIAPTAIRFSGIVPAGIVPGTFAPAGLAGIPANAYLGGYVPTGDTSSTTRLSGLQFPTGVFTQTTIGSTGNAGNIRIQTDNLQVQNQATIAATTFGAGSAGNIAINTLNGTISVDNGKIQSGVAPGSTGSSGSITLQTQSLNVVRGGLIQTQTLGAGTAGTIDITATRDVTLSGSGSEIRSGSGNSTTQGSQIGPGGDIQITAKDVQVVDRALLTAQTYTGSQGGNIIINADTFAANSGGQLRTTTLGGGQAGGITITATDRVALSGAGTGLFADTEANSAGNGGSIFIDPRLVLIQDGAGVAVNSRGRGQGGNIEIEAGTLSLDNDAFLSAETGSTQGGNITLQISDLVLLRHNSLISTTAGTASAGGNGGKITITTPFVVSILSEDNDIRANAFTGNGGRVDITAQGIFGLLFQPRDTPFSDITASSQFGVSGQVVLNTPDVDPSRGLAVLPTSLTDPSNQIAQSCSATSGQTASQFTITGRGGLPPNPIEPLSGEAVLSNWVALANSRPSNPIGAIDSSRSQGSSLANQAPAIKEAQGWVRDGNGEIFLVSQLSPNAHGLILLGSPQRALPNCR